MRRFLFDRLCEPNLHTPSDEQGKLNWLRKSISNELQRLFGQRAFFDGLQSGAGEMPSVLNFGLDDIVSYSANFEDTHQIKADCKRLISLYEPRLHNPQVTLTPTGDPLMPASLCIVGIIRTEQLEDDFVWQSGGAQ